MSVRSPNLRGALEAACGAALGAAGAQPPPSSAISMTIARAAVDGWQHRGLPGIVRLLSRHCRRLFAPGWPTAALILSRAQARVQRQTPPPTPPHGERRAFRPLRPERCSLTSE